MTKPQITMDEARRILSGIMASRSSRLDGELVSREAGSCGTVLWHPTETTVNLDGDFSAVELEAIVVYMRDNFDPTRE